jgi:hypothetical protein
MKRVFRLKWRRAEARDDRLSQGDDRRDHPTMICTITPTTRISSHAVDREAVLGVG